MPPPVILASDIMDKAAALLNDTARDLYSNAVQLPYIQLANESIEQICESLGISIIRKLSTVIDVLAGATTLDLPSDFLLPIQLWERADGSTSEGDWVEIKEIDTIIGFMPTNTLGVWAYYNNAVNFPECTTDREVKMLYERSIASITGSNSPIDTDKFKVYLSRKTAELCARFIGMNSTLADELLSREVGPTQYNLELVLVKNLQGVRKRRGSSSSRRAILL